MLYFTSFLVALVFAKKSAETRTDLRFLHYSCISEVWIKITTEIDFTVVSFTVAVNNHRYRLEK